MYILLFSPSSSLLSYTGLLWSTRRVHAFEGIELHPHQPFPEFHIILNLYLSISIYYLFLLLISLHLPLFYEKFLCCLVLSQLWPAHLFHFCCFSPHHAWACIFKDMICISCLLLKGHIKCGCVVFLTQLYINIISWIKKKKSKKGKNDLPSNSDPSAIYLSSKLDFLFPSL